ncbi:MAG: radical SAM protein [Bacilli bacterium]|nr:radical SAM protein [Bacilli bacterium]
MRLKEKQAQENENDNDIKEYKNLKKQLKSLKKEIKSEEDSADKLLEGENRKEFIGALEDATKFVDSISECFEKLERDKLYRTPHDFNDLNNKTTKKVIKAKKKDLEQIADEVNFYVENPVLTNLFLEVTLRCNAKCEHCGSSCGYKIPKDEISTEDLKRTLLEIHNRYGAQNVFLTVTGGEPLMRKDLFDIMEYAVGLGFRWGITTNGMLINEKTIENFRRTNMESISISLDGLKETHESFRRVPGSYDKIMKAIDLLKGLETLRSLQITTVANKKNLNELEDIYQMLLDKGIEEWRVMGVDPIGRAYDNDGILLDKDGLIYMFNFIREKRLEGKMIVDYDCSHYLGLKYENILRDHSFICGAGLFIGSILANGDICVCPNVRDQSLVQGNIKTDNFVDVWENKFEIFRKKRLTTNAKCKKCKSFKYCRGDSFHTWNYKEKVPNMCMKEILGTDFVE